MNVPPFQSQGSLSHLPPEGFLDTTCDRISTVAKGALLLVAAVFTGYNGYSFYYTLSTPPVANGLLGLHVVGFSVGAIACCLIQSYLPPCCSRSGS